MTSSETNHLNHAVTFAPQISTAQLQQIAEQGYKTVICNRPDGEEAEQPSIADIDSACQQLGLTFKAIPFSGGMLTQAMVEEFAEFFNAAEQPVYLYCRSGNRSSVIYQTAIQMGLLK